MLSLGKMMSIYNSKTRIAPPIPRRTEFICPKCEETINYYPPDMVGVCDCGYNTEEAD